MTSVRFYRWADDRKALLAWWAGSRLLVFAAVSALTWLKTPRGFFSAGTFADPLQPLGSWDGRWYRGIAEHGYLFIPNQQSNPAFFPFYPVLLHMLHSLGLPLLATGIVFSNLMLLVAILAVDELGRSFLPAADARRAAIYLAIFPLGYVFSMLYPQSLLLATTAIAALAALRRQWTITLVAAAIAGLTRPEGVFLLLPLAEIARRQWPTLNRSTRRRAVSAVAAAPVAFAAYPLYLAWALHNADAWSQAQRRWGRSFSLTGPWQALSELSHVGTRPWLIRDLTLFTLYLFLIASARRVAVPLGWLLAAGCILLIPITSGTFTSEGRFGLVALPIYWGLAKHARPTCADRIIRAAALATLLAATYLLPLAFP